MQLKKLPLKSEAFSIAFISNQGIAQNYVNRVMVVLLCVVISLNFSPHILSQSEREKLKPEPAVHYSHAFSRLFCWLHIRLLS